MDDLEACSVAELRKLAREEGASLEGCLEKSDIVAAVRGARSAKAESTDAMDVGDGNMDMDAGDAQQQDGDGTGEESDDEEALLRQALLMSQESESGLAALPIKELKQRALARCIDVRGITEKADLVAALLGSEAEDAAMTAQPSVAPSRAADDAKDVPPPGVEVLANFPMRFACFTAADVGLGDGLEHAGKVILPRSCLMALSFLGDLPSLMLLRMTYHDAAVHVGVADFIDDALAMDKTSEHGHSVPVWGPGGRAVAAVFVPRWVRSQLGVVNGDEPLLSLVSLPKASFLRLTPHTDAFAEALGKCADPRAVLTELMNRFVAVSVGDIIHLVVPGEGEKGEKGGEGGESGESGESGEGGEGGEGESKQPIRHALEVSALRGLAGVRCGMPEGMAQPLDVAAALQGMLGADPTKGVAVRAACLVDADVECDFAPSFETSSREAAAAEAQAAAKAEVEVAAAARAEAAERARRTAEQQLEQAAAERERRRDAARSALAALPPPPPQANAAATAAAAGSGAPAPSAPLAKPVTVAVRCPDGTRLCRTFAVADQVLYCFLLVEAEWREADASSPLPADFCLVTRHPRRCLRKAECEAAGTTFEAAGLISAQEALFVETPGKDSAS